MYYAQINADGSLGPWDQTINMPETRQHQSVHFHNGRVYIVDGLTSGLQILATAYSAIVNADGTLQEWRQEVSFPHPLWYHNSVLCDGAIYLFGGLQNYNGGAIRRIYRGVIDPSDGRITSWVDVGELPGFANEAMGAIYAPSVDGVYLIGGHETAGDFTAQVWRTIIPDCNDNQVADIRDLVDGTSQDCDHNGIPDECDIPGDINGDGCVSLEDLAAFLANYGRCVYPLR